MHVFKARNYEVVDRKNKVFKELKEKSARAYRVNRKFFGGDSIYFRITIANNEQDFKKLAGKLYNLWVKGVAIKGKGIIIRSPKLYRETYKKYGGTPSFEMLLAHEINHVFAATINLYKGPYWLTEGLAMYIAGQIPGKTYKKKARYTA